MNNQHSYYSSINGIKRNSSKKKIEYNWPSFNFGNLLTSIKYNSIGKNGKWFHNIMNNYNKIKETKTNLIYYNKHFSTKKYDNIKSILFYENKKKRNSQILFFK